MSDHTRGTLVKLWPFGPKPVVTDASLPGIHTPTEVDAASLPVVPDSPEVKVCGYCLTDWSYKKRGFGWGAPACNCKDLGWRLSRTQDVWTCSCNGLISMTPQERDAHRALHLETAKILAEGRIIKTVRCYNEKQERYYDKKTYALRGKKVCWVDDLPLDIGSLEQEKLRTEATRLRCELPQLQADLALPLSVASRVVLQLHFDKSTARLEAIEVALPHQDPTSQDDNMG